MRRLLMAVAGLLAVASCAWPLAIDGQDIGLSKMIPRAGETLTWLVPLVNDSEETFSGEVTMTMRVACRGEAFGDPVAVTQDLTLAGAADAQSLGERADFEFAWTPPRNGWHRVAFEVGDLTRAEREIAVTERDLWFAWFGAPQEFRWCNIPTTVKPEDAQWWLRRGAIPARWKGGVCYKEWPVERFVESWGDSDWIAIDEVNGPGEVTDKFIAAWEQLEEQQPHQFRAIWSIGAHEYWSEIAHLVDLFLPEIYLNYRGDHLGQFDRYLETARAAGVIEKTIPALGIHQIKDARGLVRTSPTREDVLRQVRYLKRTAPELNGLAFFNATATAQGVAEYADGLCGEYYVSPVITIADPAQPLSVSRERASAQVSATLRNVGGMDADEVRLQWRIEQPGGDLLCRTEALSLRAGEEQRVTGSFDAPAEGWRAVELRIEPSDGYTVLDGLAQTALFANDPDTILLPVTPAQAQSPITIAQGDGRREARIISAAGQPEPGRAEVTPLPARPGREEALLAFSAPEVDALTVFALREAEDLRPSPPEWTRDGDLLEVRSAWWQVRLDLATDALTGIAPADCESIIRTPFALSAPGHEGFGEARIEELPGALAVTIPWESEAASGESQYVFFRESPAIRIARVWRPNGAVTVNGAGDRCELFQRGGTFALQRGVGAPLQRGRLQDGDDYRDLLFGYLAGAPTPENAALPGWIDFSYGDGSGGLGVAIDYRWQDAAMKSYDVTRLYDAADTLEVLYVWGTEAVFERPQTSCIWLLPHGPLELLDTDAISPTQALWRHLHEAQLAVMEGLPQY